MKNAPVMPIQNSLQSGTVQPEEWLIDVMGGGTTSSSGIRVNAKQALGLPTVWNSINLIAGHIAAMPLQVRRRVGEGYVIDRNHPAYRVLNCDMNPLQTPFTGKQTAMVHAILTGNGRFWINRNGVGQVTELILLNPNVTYTVMWQGQKEHYYTPEPNYLDRPLPYQETASPYSGGQYRIPDYDVLHIPGLGWNGLWGNSLLSVARDVFGLDGAGLESTGHAYNNSGRPGLFLIAEKGKMRTQKEAEEFLSYYRKAHVGIDKTGRTALLRDGMTAQPVDAASMDDSLLGLREFSRQDLALLLGTEYLLGETSAVYKDLPDRMSAYVQNTLNKWMQAWEEECRRKLLSIQQLRADSHYFHFDASSLIRGNPNTLAEYSGKLRQQGALTGNEVRIMHGFNPVDDEALESYGNPNITTEPGSEAETEEEMQEEEQAEEVDALAQNFKTLICWEGQRLNEMAGRNCDYMAACDRFYNGLMLKKVTQLCDDLRIPQECAKRHIAESRRQLREVCGVVDSDGLPEAIANMVEKWEIRAKEFKHV